MNEDLKNVIEHYKKINWEALLREDMGKYHLKELKFNLTFIKNFFDELINSTHFESSYQPYERSLIMCFKYFLEVTVAINQYKDGGQKQNLIESVAHVKNKIFTDLNSLYDMLRIQATYSFEGRTEHPEEAARKYSQATKKMEQELRKTKQMQSQLSEQTIRSEASRYGNFFEKESEDNRKKSRFFGTILLGLSLVACLFAYKFLKFDHNIIANDIFELIIKGDVVNKVVIFSIIFLIISVIKREYLALRHQMTVNKHRHNALSSHKEILNSIHKTANESDKEISNAVLLELTKSMFSPQETGYVKDQKGSSSPSVVEVSKSMLNNPSS